MEAMVSPLAFKQVAARSTRNPIVAIRVNASAGNPNRLTINISPTKPPPAYSIWKTPNRKAIFVIEDNTEPSICIVAPIGSTILLISSGTPIFLQASILTGSVATELWAANAVTAGLKIYFSIREIPSFPAAK